MAFEDDCDPKTDYFHSTQLKSSMYTVLKFSWNEFQILVDWLFDSFHFREYWQPETLLSGLLVFLVPSPFTSRLSLYP